MKKITDQKKNLCKKQQKLDICLELYMGGNEKKSKKS